MSEVRQRGSTGPPESLKPPPGAARRYRLERHPPPHTEHYVLELERWTYRWSAGSTGKRGQSGLEVRGSDEDAQACVARKLQDKLKEGFQHVSSELLTPPPPTDVVDTLAARRDALGNPSYRVEATPRLANTWFVCHPTVPEKLPSMFLICDDQRHRALQVRVQYDQAAAWLPLLRELHEHREQIWQVDCLRSFPLQRALQGMDLCAVFSPLAARSMEAFPSIRRSVWKACAHHRCELGGQEYGSLAELRCAALSRPGARPQPVMDIAYEVLGKGRALSHMVYPRRQLAGRLLPMLVKGRPGSWLEVRSWQGRSLRVSWDGHRYVAGARTTSGVDEVLAWFEAFAREP